MSALPPTRYRVVPRDLRAHLFEVWCTIDDPDPNGHRFRLPTWAPGSYLVREFARNFIGVRARDAGNSPVRIAKEAKDTWRAGNCRSALTVVAEVHAADLSVRTAFLDATRGFFNGPSLFLCPEGREQAKCIVEIVAPPHTGAARWKVATTLASLDAPSFGFGTYHAPDYATLIDHPVEMGEFAHVAFEAGGVLHDVVIAGRHDADLPRLARDLARVCQWQIDLFGGKPDSRAPFPRYLFQVAAVGDGYGGLEHRDSASLLCARHELPAKHRDEVDDGYRRFLGLASHEYFHAWNIKRIRPSAFVPADLAREAYTRQLWAFEGLTSYYDDLALLRSGVIDVESYLELIGRTITAVLRTPGRTVQSVAESSFDAWIKYYRPDANTPNAVVSYYVKGAIVGLALDLVLRGHGSSLDALMRELWLRFGLTGAGVPENGIPRLASELAACDLDDFFARFVEGTDDPPLADLLASAGVTLSLRACEGDSDKGGKAGAGRARCTIGARCSGASELRVQHVVRRGPAERSGLSPGDTLVAIDGLRASSTALEAVLARKQPGDVLVVHAFRRDELVCVEVTLEQAPLDTAYLVLDETADADALARRRGWLGA